jgi:nicotinamidase-related amidase
MAALTPFAKALLGAPGHYGPQQTALLLLDYSHVIINNVGAKAHSAVKVAANMRAWAKSHNIETIHALIDFSGATTPLPTYKEPTRLQNLIAHVKTSGGGDEPVELLEGTARRSTDASATSLRSIPRISSSVSRKRESSH